MGGFALRRPFVALFTISALLSTIAVQAGDNAQAQVACTTSWTNAAGGDWNDDGNWNNGSPQAGDDACITMNGTYTVFVRFFETVNSVQIGGTTGTQTLSIEAVNCTNTGTQLTLNNGGTVGTQGRITLTKVNNPNNPGCAGGSLVEGVILNVAGGTLTNDGTVTTTPGPPGDGPHHLRGNITNNGTVDIDVTTFNDGGKTFLNQGSLEIADGTRFDVFQNTVSTFTNGTDGSIETAGTGHLFVGAQGTYNQGAGTTTGTRPVVVSGPSTNLNYTGTGASDVVQRFSGNLSGDLGANQDLTIEGVNCSNTGTQLTAGASFTNDGDITLTRSETSGCASGVENVILNIASGTMTNNGTLSTTPGTGGPSSHQLKGNITNNGTVDVDVNTFFFEGNRTFLNQGTVDIADGTRFQVDPNTVSIFTNGTGGSIEASGTGHLFVGAQNTYNQGAGTTTGARPVVLSGPSTNLNYTGTGASDVVQRFSGNLSGNLAANQDLTIESVNCSNSGTVLTAGAGFTNGGDITLTRNGLPGCTGGIENVILNIASGTMTNNGTLTTAPGINGGSQHELKGNVTNNGTVDVDVNAFFSESNRTFLNQGTVDIADGQRFHVSDNAVSTFTNGAGGAIDAAGAGHVFIGAQNTYNQGAGTTEGTAPRPVILSGPNTHLNYTGEGESTIATRLTGTLSGDIAEDQTLLLDAVACHGTHTQLIAGASFTNGGQITLTKIGDPACGGGPSTTPVELRTEPGTMTNEGTITVDPGTGGNGPHRIVGSLTNAPGGVIHVDRSLHLDGAGATHTNAGGLVDIGMDQMLIDHSAPYMQTSGETALAGGTGGISAVSAVSIQGGLLAGTGTISPSLSNAATVAPGGSPGLLNVSGPYTQTSAGTLEMEIEGDTPGTEHDKVAVTGAAMLDGTLDICTENSFTPSVGDEFQIMTHGSRTGTFSTVVGAGAPGGNEYAVDYGTTDTRLRVEPGSAGVALCDPSSFDVVSATPDEGGAACCVTVHVHGIRFEPGAELRLERSGEPDVNASNVVVAPDGRSLSGLFDLTGVALGQWGIVVVNPDSSTEALPGAFTVEAVQTPDLWVSVDGPALARPNRPWGGMLAYGNSGNVDAHGVIVRLSGIPGFRDVQLRVPDPPGLSSEDLDAGKSIKFFESRVAPGAASYVPLRITFVEEGLETLRARISDGQFDEADIPAIDPSIDVVMEVDNATDPATASPAILNGDYHVTGPQNGDLAFDYELTDATAHSPAVVERTEPSPGVRRYRFQGSLEAGGEIKSFDFSLEGPTNVFDVLKQVGDDPPSGGAVPRIRHPKNGNRPPVALRPTNVNPIDAAQAAAASKQAVTRAQLIDCLVTRGIMNQSEANDALVQSDGAAVAGVIGVIPVPGGVAGEVIWETATSTFQTTLDVGFDDKVEEVMLRHDPFLAQLTRDEVVAQAVQLCGTSTATASKNVNVTNSGDPNEKTGPEGSGPERFIAGDEPLSYLVKFENVPTATAPAQEVTVTDELDLDLDPSTLSLGPISFGDTFLSPPPGLTSWTTDVDLHPEQDLIVRIEAELTGNVVTWTFQSLDPNTMQPTTDAAAGFLPPNNNAPEGEGSVSFAISPDPGLASGVEMRNEASIVFDTNAPIVTNNWTNTIDNDVPTSQVDSAEKTESCSIEVDWSGNDLASGIRDFDVYVSDDGGAFELWRFETTDVSGTYPGESGHAYGFYSVARDGAGHREAPPTGADATRTLACGDGDGGTGGGPIPPTSPSPTTSPSPSPGLPDRDADGVPDIDDACPDLPGTGTDGCPPDVPTECRSPRHDACGTDTDDLLSIGGNDDLNGDGKVIVMLGKGNDTGCVKPGAGTTPIIIKGGPGDDTLIANGSGECSTTDRGVGPSIERAGWELNAIGSPSTDIRLLGDKGRDLLVGDRSANTLRGGPGNDEARGLGGDDVIRGNGGSDRLRGGKGLDGIFGGTGRDHCSGGKGRDQLQGCE